MLKKGLKPYPFDSYGSSEIRVIDDTDFACEGDDPFATAQLLLVNKFDVRAITAASFLHQEGSVERSYDKILEMLDVMELRDEVPILRGSMPMRSETDYDTSEASDFIVEEALRDDPRPLFVVCQGTITNIAVALQTRPEIASRMHVVWIGGESYPEGGWEFNLNGDVIAARVVMNSGVGLWQVTAKAYSMMRVSFAELYEKVYPCGKFGRWLCRQLWEVCEEYQKQRVGTPFDLDPKHPEGYAHFANGEMWSLGDNPVAGLLLNSQMHEQIVMGAPYINDDGSYTLRPDNPHKIAVYETVDAQFILNDLFARLRFQYGQAE